MKQEEVDVSAQVENRLTLPLSFCSIQALSEVSGCPHIGEENNFFFF